MAEILTFGIFLIALPISIWLDKRAERREREREGVRRGYGRNP